jgi:hypothetical protein
MAAGKKLWLWVLVAVGGSCLLCTAGGAVLLGLGAISGEGGQTSGSASGGTTGQPGAPGGFTFTPPSGWTSPAQGHWRVEVQEGGATLGVELIHLAAVSGLDQPEAKLATLWAERIGADWQGVSATPLVMRRFVQNGARAHFTSAPLTPKAGGLTTRVSLYLVEAGDRLEPMVMLQTYSSPGTYETIQEHMLPYSWDKTYPRIEEAIAGMQGSPVGLPLVSDEEVAGEWSYSTGSHLEWVNTLTGSTSMTMVSYGVRYQFTDGHEFTYRFQGASGAVGAMNVSQDSDEGDWRVEHDQLLLTGKRVTKYLIAGAARSPEGKRTLFLLPEPQWSLSPGAVAANGQLFVEQ